MFVHRVELGLGGYGGVGACSIFKLVSYHALCCTNVIAISNMHLGETILDS